MSDYKADFLYPYEKGSVEEAGYEFANAFTEEYRKQWWEELVKRIASKSDKPHLTAIGRLAVEERHGDRD